MLIVPLTFMRTVPAPVQIHNAQTNVTDVTCEVKDEYCVGLDLAFDRTKE